MILPAELIRNKETAFQLLMSSSGESREVAPWHEGGKSILSVFMLRGEGRVMANGHPAHLLGSGHHIFYRVPGEAAVTIVPGLDGEFDAVAFQFNESYLCRHCPEKCPNLCRLSDAPTVASLQPLCNEMPTATAEPMRELVSRICETDLPEHLQAVYRDIKIAELIIWQLEEILYGDRQRTQAGRLQDYELERVYRVHEMLRTYPGGSYTLLGLAREVGTNDATLKKHFKQVFGNTVFGYLRSCRMGVAKAMLTEKQKTVAEIAQHLGYKHVSHFSAAFRKYYGCAPTQFPVGD